MSKAMRIVGFVIGMLHYINVVLCQTNNVCPSFRDYETIKTNKKCWYDPAADSTAPEIIHKNGYPVIEYKVTTKDGYILTMYRIPNENVKADKKKDPVFLLHGIACTCSNFVSLGKSSLAFLLANEGHDVWLGNYRGNEYSQEHVNLTVHDRDYWDHSVDEIALYDVPAMLSVIQQETKQTGNIIYIGHSLGTTMGMIYASERPEEAKSAIKLFIWISPSHKLTNMLSPYRMVAPFSPVILRVIRFLDATRLVSQAAPSRNIVKTICLESTILMRLCMFLANMFFGPFSNMGPEKIPVFFNQLPGGTGLKVYGFLANQIKDRFQKKDYGWRNFEFYGRLTPPEYNVSNVQVPSYIIYGVGDWTTTRRDAINLFNKLPEESRLGIYGVSKIAFNHIDFIFGREAKPLVYDHVLEVINKFDRRKLRRNGS